MSESNEDEKYGEKYQFWQPHIKGLKRGLINLLEWIVDIRDSFSKNAAVRRDKK